MLVAMQIEKKTWSLRRNIYMVYFEGYHPAVSIQAEELCCPLVACETVEFASARRGSYGTPPAAAVVARLYIC